MANIRTGNFEMISVVLRGDVQQVIGGELPRLEYCDLYEGHREDMGTCVNDNEFKASIDWLTAGALNQVFCPVVCRC